MFKHLPALSLSFMVLFSGVAVAQVSAPAEVTAAAPKGTHLVFFRASGEQVGADAVAVFETAADASGAKQRDLVVFRKQASGFTVVAHNDKVIACSTCSQFHDDPFSAGQHIEVSPGHIHIEQMDSGETPSTTTFDFSYDTSARQWRVTDASRVQVKNGRGKGVTRKLPLPASGLLADMDGQWSTPTFWNALVVNDQKHTFSFLLSKPSEQAIDAAIHASSSCADGAACRVLVKQHDGCMGLARDADKTFFSATSPDPKAEDAVAKQALAACKAGGKGDCETVRTECSTGAM